MSNVFGSGTPLVVDSSAWARQHHPSVAEVWRHTAVSGLFATCPIVVLEVLATARDREEHGRLDKLFGALRQAPVDRAACDAAISASRDLAPDHRGIPAADYLIAAAAAARGFAVLHYDGHFDRLAPILGLESVWIARAGSL